MVVSRWSWVISTVLLGSGMGFTGIGIGTGTEAWAQAKSEEPPALEGPLVGDQSPLPPAADDLPEAQAVEPESTTADAPLHDALRLSKSRAKPERAPKSPPPPVAERASTDRPEPSARWYGGYWSWDPAREDFVWVSGAWRVPPANSIWVESRWRRDADGWYRVPGFWSPRQGKQDDLKDIEPAPDSAPAPADAAAIPAIANANAAAATNNAGDWRISGPPVDRPAESPGPAPGPDFFYIPGQYVPDGDRVTWKGGFWAQIQPGWDWVAARWSRQAEGWTYRKGYWTREGGPGLPVGRRHTVARPADGPPAILESEPADTPKGGLDDLPSPDQAERPDGGRDVITEAEDDAANRALDPLPPVVVVPPGSRYGPPVVGYTYRYRRPFRLIRPPSPLYPAGVVVPDAAPPFVQRLLNRVLP